MFVEELTYPLDQVLKGFGQESFKIFSNMGLVYLFQLLQYYPVSYEDRSKIIPLSETCTTTSAGTCIVTVLSHNFFAFRGKRILKVIVTDQTCEASLLCYGRNFLTKTLIIGEKFYLYGFFDNKNEELQSSRFEVEKFCDSPENFCKILPVYALKKKITQNKIRKCMKQALEICPSALEYLLPKEFIQEYHGVLEKKPCLESIHFPKDWSIYKQAQLTLILEEFFTFQLELLWRKNQLFNCQRSQREIPRHFLDEVKLRLPFKLTKDQVESLENIIRELGQELPMRHLLQGDVGTGKTLVAILSACPILEMGKQVVFMAPTELLAQQHLVTIEKLLNPLGIQISFLTSHSRNNSKQRKQVLMSILDGTSLFIVGTHAVFSDDIVYHDLAYVIIDEQHRFGVGQRERILAKGQALDLLLMSATPIPRTLALSIFGDLSCSKICEYPSGRLLIKTYLVRKQNLEKVHNFVLKEVSQGYQAYYVYPYIEDNKNADVSNATEMFEILREKYFVNYKVGLIHGRLDDKEKKEIMELFVNKQLDILVASSIIEIGIDVPNATVMVIESCDRFGLAALHQLRGRVGRGNRQSNCFLVYNNLSEESKARLKIIYETLDGFKIADEDLKLRGPGDLAGYQQTGVARFKLANLARDLELFWKMKEVATHVLSNEQKYDRILQYAQSVSSNNQGFRE